MVDVVDGILLRSSVPETVVRLLARDAMNALRYCPEEGDSVALLDIVEVPVSLGTNGLAAWEVEEGVCREGMDVGGGIGGEKVELRRDFGVTGAESPDASLIFDSHRPRTRSTDLLERACVGSGLPSNPIPRPISLPDPLLPNPFFEVSSWSGPFPFLPSAIIRATLRRMGVEGGDEFAMDAREVMPFKEEIELDPGVCRFPPF